MTVCGKTQKQSFTEQFMSEVVEYHQQSQVLALREGEEFLFELGNLRHFVELSV